MKTNFTFNSNISSHFKVQCVSAGLRLFGERLTPLFVGTLLFCSFFHQRLRGQSNTSYISLNVKRVSIDLYLIDSKLFSVTIFYVFCGVVAMMGYVSWIIRFVSMFHCCCLS